MLREKKNVWTLLLSFSFHLCTQFTLWCQYLTYIHRPSLLTWCQQVTNGLHKSSPLSPSISATLEKRIFLQFLYRPIIRVRLHICDLTFIALCIIQPHTRIYETAHRLEIIPVHAGKCFASEKRHLCDRSEPAVYNWKIVNTWTVYINMYLKFIAVPVFRIPDQEAPCWDEDEQNSKFIKVSDIYMFTVHVHSKIRQISNTFFHTKFPLFPMIWSIQFNGVARSERERENG